MGGGKEGGGGGERERERERMNLPFGCPLSG